MKKILPVFVFTFVFMLSNVALHNFAHADLQQRKTDVENKLQNLLAEEHHTDAKLLELVAVSNVYKADLESTRVSLVEQKNVIAQVTDQLEVATVRLENVQSEQENVRNLQSVAAENLQKNKDEIGFIIGETYRNNGNVQEIFNVLRLNDIHSNVLYKNLAQSKQNAIVENQIFTAKYNNSASRLQAISGEIGELENSISQNLQAQKDSEAQLKIIEQENEILVANYAQSIVEMEAKQAALAVEVAFQEGEKTKVTEELAAFQETQRLEAERARQAQPESSGSQRWQGGGGAPAAVGGFFGFPLSVIVLSSPFGARTNPVTGAAYEFHTGQDFSVACGSPVYAARDGSVLSVVSSNVGYGNRIVVNHGVIDGNAYATTYNHLSGFDTSVGAAVSKGQLIGFSGTTGNSTGCHLHFEVSFNGTLVNPAPYLR